ncbi:MAG: type IV toxin-antitoxin system AbiEi family antitoxin domain-containing protein [Blastocatellia bacterium]|nr:type IV toxin-antitoxin system AbiEi family antitoxin domain-containing protein [Blastocatellia bacterium]
MMLMRATGVVRASEFTRSGIHPMTLRRLVDRGIVARDGRGLYRLIGAELSENHSLIQAAKRVPNGVICLLSALRFHGLTTQKPFEVWMAIERGTRRPVVNPPPLRVHSFSGEAFAAGIEEHEMEGVGVRVYSPAKTIADCFKFRYKIGVEVALEALRDGLRQRKATVDEIWHYAEICRVARVIYPYLEALD